MGKLSGRLRIAILQRDGYKCVYCGRTSADVALEVDHVLPRARGGLDVPTNLVSACFDCNNGKSATLIAAPVHVDLQASITITATSRRRPGAFRQRGLKAKCDLCGDRADTVHFVPWVTLDNAEMPDVVFACPSHDPGGYWLTLDDWNEGPPDRRDPTRMYTSRTHINDKEHGWIALVRMDERLLEGDPVSPRTVVHWYHTGTESLVETWGPGGPSARRRAPREPIGVSR